MTYPTLSAGPTAPGQGAGGYRPDYSTYPGVGQQPYGAPYGGMPMPAPAPAPQTPPPPPRDLKSPGKAAWIAIIMTVIGAIIAIGTIWGGAWDAVRDANDRTVTTTASVEGVSALALHASGMWVDVIFDDVPEAVLTTHFRGGEDESPLALSVVGGTLKLEPTTNIVNWRPFANWGEERSATLVLPTRLGEGTYPVGVEVGSGGLTISGAFSSVTATVSSGHFSFWGSARDVLVEVQSGAADVQGSFERDVTVTVSSGAATLIYEHGVAPTTTTLSVSSGAIDAHLPGTTFKVTDRNSNSGILDIDVPTSETSKHALSADVNSGFLSVSGEEW